MSSFDRYMLALFTCLPLFVSNNHMRIRRRKHDERQMSQDNLLANNTKVKKHKKKIFLQKLNTKNENEKTCIIGLSSLF